MLQVELALFPCCFLRMLMKRQELARERRHKNTADCFGYTIVNDKLCLWKKGKICGRDNLSVSGTPSCFKMIHMNKVWQLKMANVLCFLWYCHKCNLRHKSKFFLHIYNFIYIILPFPQVTRVMFENKHFCSAGNIIMEQSLQLSFWHTYRGSGAFTWYQMI